MWTLACLQPFAFIHAALLFTFSHIRECSLIFASDIPIDISEPTIGCSPPNFALSSGILLPLNNLYPGVRSNFIVHSLANLLNGLLHSRVSFEFIIILSNAVSAILLSVHMCTFLRITYCTTSWAAIICTSFHRWVCSFAFQPVFFMNPSMYQIYPLPGNWAGVPVIPTGKTDHIPTGKVWKHPLDSLGSELLRSSLVHVQFHV